MSFLFLILLSFGALYSCSSVQSTNKAAPTVNSMQITILAGEQANIEIDVQDNVIVGIKKVTNITDPKKTMTFNFMKDNDRKSMMLSVKNPLTSTVKYHIDMVDYRGGLHQTSSCPVMAGLSVFESWPHPIPEIRVTNFHFAAGRENEVCIY